MSPIHCKGVNTQNNLATNFEDGVYPQVSQHSPPASLKWQACEQLKKVKLFICLSWIQKNYNFSFSSMSYIEKSHQNFNKCTLRTTFIKLRKTPNAQFLALFLTLFLNIFAVFLRGQWIRKGRDKSCTHYICVVVGIINRKT